LPFKPDGQPFVGALNVAISLTPSPLNGRIGFMNNFVESVGPDGGVTLGAPFPELPGLRFRDVRFLLLFTADRDEVKAPLPTR
jgi:hypothetical protein